MRETYYAVIPGTVRFCQELSSTAKLLYGDITSMCSRDGYCTASNSYLASLVNTETRSVRRMIQKLCELGFLESVMVFDEVTNEQIGRKLYISDTPAKYHKYQQLREKNEAIYREDLNVLPGRTKMSSNNNTKENTNSNSYFIEDTIKRSIDKTNKEIYVEFEKLDVNIEKKRERKTQETKDVEIIFEAWREKFRPKAKLDDKRRKRIAARIKDGFSKDDLLKVIKGVQNSPWHLGDNESRTKYIGIETIYRDAGQVEKFIALASEKVISSERVVIEQSAECIYCTVGRKCQIHRGE